MNGSGSEIRTPALILSQDYELFFGPSSGTVDACLFEPCERLLEFARLNRLRITFYVDAGMLCRMRRMAPQSAALARQFGDVQDHIRRLHLAGHEIGLHVHPHWEDTRWTANGWDFSGTRYRFSEFSDDEIDNVFRTYASVLQDLTDGGVVSYRAGGLCVEPFERIRDVLLSVGIYVDSSVVPGASIRDPSKGFDFRSVPDRPCWRFESSPRTPVADGRFLEVSITPVRLPKLHYWGRLADRLKRRQRASGGTAGESKAIGKLEIVRRLLGMGNVSELSLDAAKARELVSRQVCNQQRDLWQVMGHPKLLGPDSLTHLAHFIRAHNIRRFETVASFAARVGGE